MDLKVNVECFSVIHMGMTLHLLHLRAVEWPLREALCSTPVQEGCDIGTPTSFTWIWLCSQQFALKAIWAVVGHCKKWASAKEIYIWLFNITLRNTVTTKVFRSKFAIIQNFQSRKLWRCALREDVLTLDNLLAKPCSLEASECHPTPIIDDLIHTLYGTTVFSKLDLRAGYHQLTLASESCYITTFATHKGLHQYTQLNIRKNSASEIFQNVINDQIRDITRALNISDDIIVSGRTQAEHDAALQPVLQRLQRSTWP